ncbi:MAG: hypothetical protein MJ107_04925 [Lachnospiraceae bacterium]|nr:hypothetical protein [Lachnospiraceae bacterium]
MKIVKLFGNYILIALLLAGCFYAIHDTQTAYGVGYFFSLKSSSDARVAFDIMVDLIYFCLLLFLCAIPVLLDIKAVRKSGAKVFLSKLSKSIILYCGLMPIQRADYIIALFRKETYEVTMPFTKTLNEVAAGYRIIVPFFVLAVGFCVCLKRADLKKYLYRTFAIAGCVLLPGLFVPALLGLSIFVSSFIVLVSIFAVLDKSEFESELIYGFLYMVSIYNLVCVTAI